MFAILVQKDLESSAVLDKEREGGKHIAFDHRAGQTSNCTWTPGFLPFPLLYLLRKYLDLFPPSRIRLQSAARKQPYAALRATRFRLLIIQICDTSVGTASIDSTCLPTNAPQFRYY